MALTIARSPRAETAKPLTAKEAELYVVSAWRWSKGSEDAEANRVFKIKVWTDYGISDNKPIRDFLNKLEAGDGVSQLNISFRGSYDYIVVAAPGLQHNFSFNELAHSMSSSISKIKACRDMLYSLYHEDLENGDMDSYVRAYKATLEE
jgi:hypothetical protein